MREKLIASSALCAGTQSCWKMKNSLKSDIWRAASVITASRYTISKLLLTNPWLRYRQVSNWCNVNPLVTRRL